MINIVIWVTSQTEVDAPFIAALLYSHLALLLTL